ncbi:hypothetical protein BpHYR1_034437 [Brachionus plicatilis]|uniref:Uncharacterized protein n=1 Tax=Brachionus plicatilis TaxID=10195 RepID=A0A3M7P3J4_BRAPC|nr:hypothetical protein BpHYR1_034437 [Brachionus plicatilis]
MAIQWTAQGLPKVGRPAIMWKSTITKELIEMGMTWGEAKFCKMLNVKATLLIKLLKLYNLLSQLIGIFFNGMQNAENCKKKSYPNRIETNLCGTTTCAAKATVPRENGIKNI